MNVICRLDITETILKKRCKTPIYSNIYKQGLSECGSLATVGRSVNSDTDYHFRGCEIEPQSQLNIFPTFDKYQCGEHHSSSTNGLTFM